MRLSFASVEDIPGVSAAVLRDRAYGWFAVSLEEALSRLKPHEPLGAEASDDFSIALVEIWAAVADVLTFYEERVANEAFLGAAREWASVRELASLIDYELHDGVGASAEVAFHVEPAKGKSEVLTIPAGTVVITSERGESSERFVTVEDIEARTEWNVLRPRRSDDVIEGDGIDLDDGVEGLLPGRLLLVVGVDAATKEEIAELVVLANTTRHEGGSRLALSGHLHHVFSAPRVRLLGNVARATASERIVEVVGSGDGSVPFQWFPLSERPAASVPAEGSTIDVRVGGVRWEEVPGLGAAGPNDPVYVTEVSEDGTATIRFGDGVRGARLPDGKIIMVGYRVGEGPAGNVGPERLSTLSAPPLGVAGVANPLPASGGTDPEQLDRIRQSAPSAARSPGRLVSTRDFEEAALAVPGIAKAQARPVWDGEEAVMHVTVATSDGRWLPANSAVLSDLSRAISDPADPAHQVVVQSFVPVPFTLAARVVVDARHPGSDVVRSVWASLAEAFSFERRSLGQAVEADEVLAVMQQIVGVASVSLDALFEVGGLRRRNSRLVARSATAFPGRILPAELLTIDPSAMELSD